MIGNRRNPAPPGPEGAPPSKEETRASAAEASALARCRAGDREAYRILVSLHERAVTAVVYRILLHPQETEDVVQETFIQGFLKLASFKGDSRFGTWLHRIAVNLALRRLQRLRQKGWTPLDALDGLELPDLRPHAPQPEREALKAEEQRALQAALLRLSDAHRAVVTLHYYEGLSCPEIAHLMDCSVGTVWSRLHYAMRKLKDEIKDGEPSR